LNYTRLTGSSFQFKSISLAVQRYYRCISAGPLKS